MEKLHRWWSIKFFLQTNEELKTCCRIENLEKAQAHSPPAQQALHRQTAGLLLLLLLLRHHVACSMDWKGTANRQYLQTLIVREQLATSSTIPPCFPALVSLPRRHIIRRNWTPLCASQECAGDTVLWIPTITVQKGEEEEEEKANGRSEWQQRLQLLSSTSLHGWPATTTILSPFFSYRWWQWHGKSVEGHRSLAIAQWKLGRTRVRAGSWGNVCKPLPGSGSSCNPRFLFLSFFFFSKGFRWVTFSFLVTRRSWSEWLSPSFKGCSCHHLPSHFWAKKTSIHFSTNCGVRVTDLTRDWS